MPHFLQPIADWLDLILNALQTCGVALSLFFVLFFLANRFSGVLRDVLRPLGAGPWLRFRALFSCGRGIDRKRAFVEYALLRTGGEPVDAGEWRAILSEFRNRYAERDASRMVFDIPNCTALIGAPFSEAAARYFRAFSDPKRRRAFGLPAEGETVWVFRIRIRESYVTPTCLLAGLLSRYEENWSKFISRYVAAASMDPARRENRVRTDELYLTFGWLLWGPSYEIAFRNYWDGLCQISYGDESNSVPAFANPVGDCLPKLKGRLLDAERSRFGTLVETLVSLREKKAFFREFRKTGHPENDYFLRKIGEDGAPFAVRIESFAEDSSLRESGYYCTAYVWLLFERLSPDGGEFRPERSVAFFEHANLADGDSYRFLVSTLGEKALAHFRKVSADPERAGSRYRFVCAMNQRIEEDFGSRFGRERASGSDFGRWLGSHVDLVQARPPEEAFSSIDSFFSDSGDDVSFSEAVLPDKRSLADFGEFYTRIYMEAFPDADEREKFDNMLRFLADAEDARDYRYHVVLAKNASRTVVGGAIFDYFPASNSGVVEFIAVDEAIQTSGIGTKIYEHVRKVLRQDALDFGRGTVDRIFCEVDKPDHSRQKERKYISFWRKNHFRRIDFDYVQPALSPEQKPVDGLWFLVAPQPDPAGRIAIEDRISSETVLSVLSDYLRHCMRISEPEKDGTFVKMAAELRGKGTARLLPLRNSAQSPDAESAGFPRADRVY